MIRYLLVTVLAGCASAPVTAQPKADDPVAKVLADWKARQGKVKTARYVVTGTVEQVGAFSERAGLPPANDRVRPFRAALVLDLARGRYRQEQAGEKFRGGAYESATTTMTYDGREAREGRPRSEAARGGYDLIISPGVARDKGDLIPTANFRPLLYAHGLVPNTSTKIDIPRLPFVYDPDNYRAAGRLAIGGRTLQVFRTEPTHHAAPIVDEYWIDPAPGRHSPVVRYVHLTGNEPWLRTEIAWRETPAGWWPETWTTTTMQGGRTLAVRKCRVESSELDGPVADGEFTIPAEPGMEHVIVNEPAPAGADVLLPAKRRYRITPSGGWEEFAAQGALTPDGVQPVTGSGYLPAEARRWYRHWPWAVAGVVAVGVSAWGWRRRRSRAVAAAT